MEHANVDVLVVGAGFSGIYQLYKLREGGLSVKLIDNGSEVGGTWYWNRYPGAGSDTTSEVYRYSWDKEDLASYKWTNRYLSQVEIQAYLKHVVDRHQLQQYIQLNTELQTANFENGVWRAGLSTGEIVNARYLVTALGGLSKTYIPDIPGIESFSGKLCHSSDWPKDLELNNKRVGIIGNGSTGAQIMTSIADKVEKLILFQRHPHYAIPNRDGPSSDEQQKLMRKSYDEIWNRVQNSFFGYNVDESKVRVMSLNEQDREAAFEKGWDDGYAMNFLFGVFCDIVSDSEANEEAAKFIRKKISQIVKDPEKARKLTPTGIWTRRPVNGANYYEIFNKDNVDIVDIKKTPMTITSSGIKTTDGTVHELDIIILATGFQAFDGSYARIDFKGIGGQTLRDHWVAGPKTYLAIANAGFPNMFMVQGPQGPYGNVPPIIEPQVELISHIISHTEAERNKELRAGNSSKESSVIVEASIEGEDEWATLCQRLSDSSLFSKGEESTWLFGTNVKGAQAKVLFYLGGLASYRKRLQDEKDNGLQGFTFSKIVID